ncbi:MerR family transcriptional regulator [Peribacillus acanthi]|uniref:MerR family transcriptional regulator n=1 Tax=Peribacillus acanthi TaxID=2171554 RepID=UPI000D3E79CE|nr:MerR family transcriptional regulator [Peribacillus acanthi]
MNTKTVSRILNVSPKTIRKWVKQLNLDLNKNELGHFLFEKEDVEELKRLQQQLQKGVLLQDVQVIKKPDKETRTIKNETEMMEKFLSKLDQVERKLDQKADAVVSYQLLQHRREIEELHEEITRLNHRIVALEKNQRPSIPIDPLPFLDHKIVTNRKNKTKIKNLLTMLFTMK